MINLQKKSLNPPALPQHCPKKSSKNNRLQPPPPKPSTALTDQRITPADLPIGDFSQVNYLRISAHQEGQRMDNFLLSRLKGLPRSHVYKMIRDGEIRCNKKRVKAHQRLNIGDVVRIAPVHLSTAKSAVVGADLQQALLAAVVYEDDGLLVLNKPHGLAVHGGSGVNVGAIEALRVATDQAYLELIHRIDKGTSGLLMIAKKRSVLKTLQDALRQQQLQKTYLCAVIGKLRPQEIRCEGVKMLDTNSALIDKPLLKYTLKSGEWRVRVDKMGKPSSTRIEVLGYGKLNNLPITLIKASPKTGRTHQIRVHLAALGFAIIGDDKYTLHQQQNLNPQSFNRLYLHAWQLALPGYDLMVAPLPDALQALINHVHKAT